MKALITGVLSLAVLTIIGCQGDLPGTSGPEFEPAQDDVPGVFGYVYEGVNPKSGVKVRVTDLSGFGFPWYKDSNTTGSNGYWTVSFTSEEAEELHGHTLKARVIGTEYFQSFVFSKPRTGPINIYMD